jgi:enediyne biosynthesis protein E4
VNMPPFICRNGTDKNPDVNFLNISLKGTGKNTAAIGTAVTVYCNGKTNYRELFPNRGFQSTVDNRLSFGLGKSKVADSVRVEWPDGRCTILYNVKADQFLKLDQTGATGDCPFPGGKNQSPVFSETTVNGLDFRHIENNFNDFERDKLLFRMLSNEGPHTAVADVNGDGLDDIYICGAKDSPGALYVQDEHGHFKRTNEKLFYAYRISEDTDCAFFDADGDGDQDLYVASGGNEFPSSSSALSDRLYLNTGKGEFKKSEQILPAGKYESSSCVQPADFDNDGDIDLFVGIRLIPFAYGLATNGYLLENDGKGIFSDVTSKRAPGLQGVGMITDMAWADVDNDGDNDIVIVGDWMPVKVFINNNGGFTDQSEKYGLSFTEGWWHTIIAKDLNGDGKIDFILGNDGLNSRFRASKDKPVKMYVNDFDLNGSIEQIICAYNGEKSYPLVQKDDLVKQIPSLAKRYSKFDDYKDQTIEDIFTDEVLNRAYKLNARVMESCVLINSGKGSFSLTPLPVEAQFTPVYAIATGDFNRDGYCDILLGGNQYRVKPEMGINDAGYGLFLKGTAHGQWLPVSSLSSGIFVKGEIRDFTLLKVKGSNVIVTSKNNDYLQFYKY